MAACVLPMDLPCVRLHDISMMVACLSLLRQVVQPCADFPAVACGARERRLQLAHVPPAQRRAGHERRGPRGLAGGRGLSPAGAQRRPHAPSTHSAGAVRAVRRRPAPWRCHGLARHRVPPVARRPRPPCAAGDAAGERGRRRRGEAVELCAAAVRVHAARCGPGLPRAAGLGCSSSGSPPACSPVRDVRTPRPGDAGKTAAWPMRAASTSPTSPF